ncbi:hypothetical protein GCM10025876_34060 [Demequina litorisediminis]|uniref:Uncharacterized protein n=1 Tax=Demequina litorisediminis TaxID=1849022 RepID=A0ABQ6IJ74_9MICO|nr:hypothetical protein GCM10025876_34060 [Demequina litorisediminis]
MLRDVGRHARIRGRRRREDGDALRQVAKQSPDTAVVGPEVVAPIRDAMRLIDHHESGIGRQTGKNLVTEAGVVEAFG